MTNAASSGPGWSTSAPVTALWSQSRPRRGGEGSRAGEATAVGSSATTSAAWTRVVHEDANLTAADALVVTFIDVGQGDAILLQLGDVDVLVDTGPVTAWHENLRKSLASVHGALEMLFITHPHDDHYGGAKDVLDGLEVKGVYTNGEGRGPPRDPGVSASWHAVEQAVANEHLAIQTLEDGEVLQPAPGLVIRVLAAGGHFPDKPGGSYVNNDSLVLMVEFAGRRLLLTGDIETEADRRMVEVYCGRGKPTPCAALHADVLKVPHHGSANFDATFFAAVKPDWAVISAAYRNEANCLPRLESVAALRGVGAKVGSTSADGVENIVLRVESTGAMSWTWPTQKAFGWSRAAGTNSVCQPESYPQAQ